MYLSLNKSKLKEALKFNIGGSTIFMISAIIVNGGNYLYNVFLGRAVSPQVFAETGLLVTLLLILSFLGMTFQLASAKFIVEIDDSSKLSFQKSMVAVSIISGTILGVLTWFFSDTITVYFNLTSSGLIEVFAIGIPFYFYMSVMRGFVQGKQKFIRLSVSYQVEMISRFAITVILIFVLNIQASLSVALSISVSIIAGALVCGIPTISLKLQKYEGIRALVVFFLFTAGYELMQMLINYFDLILVKHYFDATLAGFYTALSLIGRMIYFITWMVVMLLLPKVVNNRKEGKPYQQLLNTYLLYLGLFVAGCVAASALFPDLVVTLVFGEEYSFISEFLWGYALATGFFALGNIFTYYYLSLGNYKPVFIMGFFAIFQIMAITFYHESFKQIIQVQILCMGLGLVAQALYHYGNTIAKGLQKQ